MDIVMITTIMLNVTMMVEIAAIILGTIGTTIAKFVSVWSQMSQQLQQPQQLLQRLHLLNVVVSSLRLLAFSTPLGGLVTI